MRAEREKLKGVNPRGLIQGYSPEEASFKVRSSRSAQQLSPELACRKKSALAERHGQRAWAEHIIEY